MPAKGDIVLVIGGGGREHAVIKALAQSPEIKEIHAAPGNGGIASLAHCHDLAATDIEGLLELAKELKCDFVVVTPDDPLALGLVDILEAEGIKAFGPSKAAARIESSKIFAKQLMNKLSIPTAAAEIFCCQEKALKFLEQASYPLVIKADGLAQGKGVIICQGRKEAENAVRDIMAKRIFGASGKNILIEEYLSGPELTMLCFSDGQNLLPLPSSRDHKKIGEGNTGPNTGGMGAISPVPEMNKELEEEIMAKVFTPLIKEMAAMGNPFRGIIYGGLMLTSKGPFVIEFNARFGDPETQAVLPLLENDLYSLMKAARAGELGQHQIQIKNKASCAVVLASEGYPGKYKTGCEIFGLADIEDAEVYHAGTKLLGSKYITSGGRVLAVSAQADKLEDAIALAYRELEKIKFDNCIYRSDIGKS